MLESLLSLSWTTLLLVTLTSSAPLALAALGGLLSERSGVINIGLEGMMLMGAFFTAWTGIYGPAGWKGALLGLGLAALAGGMMAALHALLCLRGGADQIISGVALNIFASEMTIFLSLWIYGTKGSSGLMDYTFSAIPLGPLRLPLFFGLVVAVWGGLTLLLFRTSWGLRLRACGEHPEALHSAGISPRKVQMWAVLASGCFAGLAGAALVHGAGNFSKNMTAGRGYIALAALVFGNWLPHRVVLACLLFGFAYALNFQLQALPTNKIPSEFLSMLPYVLTLLALMGWVGRTRPPAALGKPLDI
ncbi:MAG: ABC transporter permease [Myxococcales bacterium]|nr:ABC transporter permease [Myxococcales bacterium]